MKKIMHYLCTKHRKNHGLPYHRWYMTSFISSALLVGSIVLFLFMFDHQDSQLKVWVIHPLGAPTWQKSKHGSLSMFTLSWVFLNHIC